MKKEYFNSMLFLHIAVAAFFILIGIVGLAYDVNEINRFGGLGVRLFGRGNNVLNILIAILCLASGIILLLGLFVHVNSKVLFAAALGIVIFWILRIIWVFFVNGLYISNFLIWLEQLSFDVVILAAVWLVARRHL
jgi:hypothetical protein